MSDVASSGPMQASATTLMAPMREGDAERDVILSLAVGPRCNLLGKKVFKEAGIILVETTCKLVYVEHIGGVFLGPYSDGEIR